MNNRDLIAQALMAHQQQVDTYNSLTAGNVPLPVPGPRRELQNRQDEIDTYNSLTGNVPLPVPGPRRELQNRQDEIDTYNMLMRGR